MASDSRCGVTSGSILNFLIAASSCTCMALLVVIFLAALFGLMESMSAINLLGYINTLLSRENLILRRTGNNGMQLFLPGCGL